MKLRGMVFLLAALGLTSMACGPSDISTSPPAKQSPDAITSGTASKSVVIPVNQKIEQKGITVEVTEVTLTGQEVTVSYRYDCGPNQLEPMQP